MSMSNLNLLSIFGGTSNKDNNKNNKNHLYESFCLFGGLEINRSIQRIIKIVAVALAIFIITSIVNGFYVLSFAYDYTKY